MSRRCTCSGCRTYARMVYIWLATVYFRSWVDDGADDDEAREILRRMTA